jgi:predicted nucleic acid-binding protein
MTLHPSRDQSLQDPRGGPGRRANLGADLRVRDPARTAQPANDTWIAACALTYGLPLATLNAKDFKDFAEHDGLNLLIQTG